MPNIRVIIPKKELSFLYHQRNKSLGEIAEKYGCTGDTIRNRLGEYKIPKKTKAQAHIKLRRTPFSGNFIEKAYLIGFRLGDLNVYQTRGKSSTLVVRTNTTSKAQVRLMEFLFKKYGRFTVSYTKEGTYQINCFVDQSFSFLLPKQDCIPKWAKEQKDYFVAFMAGYIDAEGSFGLNQEKGRFKMDSYDKGILREIHLWLNKHGIQNKYWQIAWKGEERYDGGYWNKDLWRITVNYAQDIYNFCELLKPYLKHKKRIKNMNTVLQNIQKRKNNHTIAWKIV